MRASRRITTTALVALVLLVAAMPAAAAGAGKVNINQASADQLALLPRVGPSVAQRIVEFREANGPFRSIEDLMLVRGVGEKTFELLEPYLSLEGSTTLTEKVRAPRQASEQESED
jgi:competence protein ComEA